MKAFPLLFILISCGQVSKTLHKDVVNNPTNKPTGKTTNKVFSKYVEEFESHYGASVDHIPINFADLTNQNVGVCHTRKDGSADIEVDKKEWDTLT